LRLTGADLEDVAGLIGREKPDLLLMQEATRHFEALPALVGGHFHRLSWLRPGHRLSGWGPHRLPPPPPPAVPPPPRPRPARPPPCRAGGRRSCRWATSPSPTPISRTASS